MEIRTLELRPRYPPKIAFQARSRWTRTGGLILEVGKTQIDFGHKVRNNEPQGHPCPYELFAGAIGGCIINTFLDLTSRRNLSVSELDFQTSVSIRLKGKKYKVESITINGIIGVPIESQQIARKLMDLAFDYCALLNLVRKGVALSIKFGIRTADSLKEFTLD